MKTLVKINVLTDDPGLPDVLRDKFEAVLKEEMQADPDPRTVDVRMEFKDTVHSEAYMRGLIGQGADRIRLPPPSGTSATKRSAPVAKRKVSRSGATAE